MDEDKLRIMFKNVDFKITDKFIPSPPLTELLDEIGAELDRLQPDNGHVTLQNQNQENASTQVSSAVADSFGLDTNLTNLDTEMQEIINDVSPREEAPLVNKTGNIAEGNAIVKHTATFRIGGKRFTATYEGPEPKGGSDQANKKREAARKKEEAEKLKQKKMKQEKLEKERLERQNNKMEKINKEKMDKERAVLSLEEERTKNQSNVMHTCTFCSNEYEFFEHLELHLKTFHGVDGFRKERGKRMQSKFEENAQQRKEKNLPDIEENTEEKYPCRICDKPYKSNSGRIRHEKEDHDAHRIPCPKCNKTFRRYEYFVKHYKRYHSEKSKTQKLRKCRFCKHMLKSEVAMNTHEKSKHLKKYLKAERLKSR